MLPVRDQLPTRSPAYVNFLLIGLNVLVFAAEVASPAPLAYSLIPAELMANPIAAAPSLLGHMFLHGGLSHVAGNMLFLWIFGDNVEDALGHGRYLAFYLACGLGAAFAQIAASPHSVVPMVGASGAIAGVLAAYGFLYPRSVITVVNPIPLLWLFWGFFMYLPAWLVIAEFFVVNLWSALQPTSAAGGVAFMAHVGGFLTGAILLRTFRNRQAVDHDRWQRLLEARRRNAS